jgi:acyl-CoA thioesterase FadM
VHWPRVHADFDYHAPLFFEDEIDIKLLVMEKRTKTLKYKIIIEKTKPKGEPQRVATGHLVVCCTVSLAEGGMRGVAIPPSFAAKIEVAPETLL